MTDVDTTAADVLMNLDETLNGRGVSLVFAELKDPVREKIERYGLIRTIDPGHFYPTVGAAVAAFRTETGTEWPATDGTTTTKNGQDAALTEGNSDGQKERQQKAPPEDEAQAL